MNYEEFKQEVVARIKEFLPSFYASAEVTINQVRKVNECLDGLNIHTQESIISPQVYLEPFYQAYYETDNFEMVMENIADMYIDAMKTVPIFEDEISIESFKGKPIICQLINAEMNKDLLENVPHRLFLDFAVIYLIILEKKEVRSSVMIMNSHLPVLGYTEQDLYEIAMKTTSEYSPIIIRNMNDILKELQVAEGIELPDILLPQNPMYVLSNSDKYDGAIALLYKDKLMETAEILGHGEKVNFYILPSSIHEIIVLSTTADYEVDYLKEMVRDVNDTQLKKSEILSYNVYYYDCESNEISIVE